MKKYLFILFFVNLGILVYGQNSIPNGNFENWTTGTSFYPQFYPYTSNVSSYLTQAVFNVTRTNDSYHGTYAVQLATTTIPGDTAFGYFVNIIPGNSSPLVWHGGMPYNQIPSGIKGYYKYNVSTADSATLIIAFSKGGSNIRTYFYKIGGVNSSYKLFNFTFNPALSTTPDSVEFGALSCKFDASMQQPLGVAGSVLKLDSVYFTGVSSQPDQMNGDFELWQSQSFNFPTQWHLISGSEQETGVFLSNDAFSGNYAVELKTFSGSKNNHPAAQGAAISTGYYPTNCNSNCYMRGGFPFTNRKDTLVFFYKYTPSFTDSSLVYLIFKKNGALINTAMTYLHASATYQKKVLPFDVGIDPDSVIVSISSSDFRDTTLSFVGSDLKIDDLNFKSQTITTGINRITNENGKILSIFPNPSSGKFKIRSMGSGSERLEIYDLHGTKVYSISKFDNREPVEVDISRYSKGSYFVRIYDGPKIFSEQILIE
jgi:hypothetical protein